MNMKTLLFISMMLFGFLVHSQNVKLNTTDLAIYLSSLKTELQKE